MYFSVLVAALLPACAMNTLKQGVVYGLCDDELNLLGRRLGYRVEGLGMSDYTFSRGGHAFHVQAHNNIAVYNRCQADQPVQLSCNLPGTRTTITSSVSVEHGITFAEVEAQFRNFIRDTHLPRPRNPQ
jgi:hypothetical protein